MIAMKYKVVIEIIHAIAEALVKISTQK